MNDKSRFIPFIAVVLVILLGATCFIGIVGGSLLFQQDQDQPITDVGRDDPSTNPENSTQNNQPPNTSNNSENPVARSIFHRTTTRSPPISGSANAPSARTTPAPAPSDSGVRSRANRDR